LLIRSSENPVLTLQIDDLIRNFAAASYLAGPDALAGACGPSSFRACSFRSGLTSATPVKPRSPPEYPHFVTYVDEVDRGLGSLPHIHENRSACHRRHLSKQPPETGICSGRSDNKALSGRESSYHLEMRSERDKEKFCASFFVKLGLYRSCSAFPSNVFSRIRKRAALLHSSRPGR